MYNTSTLYSVQLYQLCLTISYMKRRRHSWKGVYSLLDYISCSGSHLYEAHTPSFLKYYVALCCPNMSYDCVATGCDMTSPYAVLWCLFLTWVISIGTFILTCQCTTLHCTAQHSRKPRLSALYGNVAFCPLQSEQIDYNDISAVVWSPGWHMHCKKSG